MARTMGFTAYFYADTTAIRALPITMACWFNCESDRNEALMSVGRAEAGFSNCFEMIILSSTDQVRGRSVAFNGTSTASALSTGTRTPGTWHHAMTVCSGTSSRQAFLDGVAGAVQTSGIGVDEGSWTRISVGTSWRETTASLPATAQIAEAAFWNSALNEAEATQLAAGYSPMMIRPQNLVAYFPMHGRSGSSGGEDDWISGIDMTLVGSPVISDHPRIIYPGRGQRVFAPSAAVAGFRAAWVPRTSQFIGAR